jgi:hypothetical protein
MAAASPTPEFNESSSAGTDAGVQELKQAFDPDNALNREGCPGRYRAARLEENLGSAPASRADVPTISATAARRLLRHAIESATGRGCLQMEA